MQSRERLLSAEEAIAVLDTHTYVLERLTFGERLTVVLSEVVTALEELMPGSRCSILQLVDGVLRHAAAPHLPPAYSAAIDGLVPGPLAGSCGTAAFTGKAVVAEDVFTDERWEPFRDLATVHGIRACWSSPILGSNGVLGTFAVYHDVAYVPDAHDAELVGRFSHLALLAIEHSAAQAERSARLEAEVAKQVAEDANRAKSTFVTSLSHELRSPLQAITGLTELLAGHDLTPARRQEALARITSATAHILSLVDDVLDLARVEAGAMTISAERVATDLVIGESVELLQPLAERRGIEIVAVSAAAEVHADRRRLRQILINLLANAVRFSPEGGSVEIRTEVIEDEVTLSVVDGGPGIPAALLGRLFVPFERLGADALGEGGAGLGLVLARRLAEAMGGSLDVASTVGVGTIARIGLRRIS